MLPYHKVRSFILHEVPTNPSQDRNTDLQGLGCWVLLVWPGEVGGGCCSFFKKVNGNLQFLQQTEKDISEKAAVLSDLYSVFYAECVISLKQIRS